MHGPRTATVIFVLAFAAALSHRPGAEEFTLNSNDVLPRSASDGSGYEDRILAEAFRRLGHTYSLVRVPSERALVSVDRGELDGDYVRIAGLENAYANLVCVAEPIASFDFATFTGSASLRIDDWEDLRTRPVGMIIGWKIVEQKTKGFGSVNAVRDEAALFALLLSGRVDAVVYDLLEGLRHIERTGAEGKIFVGPVLERRGMYLYLNRKHASLAAELAAVLRGMRKEGEIDRMTKEAIGRPARR